MLEQEYAHRLATIRLIRPVIGSSQVFIDLLFASSGIEDQIVADADRLEMWPGCQVAQPDSADSLRNYLVAALLRGAGIVALAEVDRRGGWGPA